MNKIILIIIFITSLWSCNNSNNHNLGNIETLRTNELLGTILSNFEEDGIRLDCIYEKANFLEDNPEYDYYSMLIKHLKIKDSLHLNNQIKLYEKFSINEALCFNRKIIPDSLRPSNREELYEFEKYIDKNCPNGSIAFSKPIFSEDFNLAFLVYSAGIGGSGSIYKYENGIWEFKESIYHWIP